jgi:CRP-like cAMP-binding protein
MSIFSNNKIKLIEKGTILLRQGEICNFGCKVIEGCLKSYFIDKTGKEHIIQFAPEDWIITDMNSLLNRVPSNIFIEAIEDSRVYWIHNDTNGLLDIWEQFSKEELIEQVQLFTKNIIAGNNRTRMLLSSTGKERYLDFITTYPTLLQRIPLKLIASYIGVTPEYLSEIRKKLAGK